MQRGEPYIVDKWTEPRWRYKWSGSEGGIAIFSQSGGGCWSRSCGYLGSAVISLGTEEFLDYQKNPLTYTQGAEMQFVENLLIPFPIPESPSHVEGICWS